MRVLRGKIDAPITDTDFSATFIRSARRLLKENNCVCLKLFQQDASDPGFHFNPRRSRARSGSSSAVRTGAASDMAQLLGGAAALQVEDSSAQDTIAEDLAALAEQLKYSSLRMRDLVQGDTQARAFVPLFVSLLCFVLFGSLLLLFN